jgi:hypothetical protein
VVQVVPLQLGGEPLHSHAPVLSQFKVPLGQLTHLPTSQTKVVLPQPPARVHSATQLVPLQEVVQEHLFPVARQLSWPVGQGRQVPVLPASGASQYLLVLLHPVAPYQVQPVEPQSTLDSQS